MLENLYMVISLASITYVMYTLIMRPLNLKYQRALDHVLGKEIARRSYQRLHPEFKYEVYHIDDQNERRLLDETLKEFETLIQTQKSVTSAHDVTEDKAKQ